MATLKRSEQVLKKKFSLESWYPECHAYLKQEFEPMEDDLGETVRYVEWDKRNADTFSTAFGSIIRRIRCAYGGTMVRLIKGTTAVLNESYTIVDYNRWLVANVPAISQLSLEVELSRSDRYFVPFLALQSPEYRLSWWDSLVDVDPESGNLVYGTLKNAFEALASLAVIYILMHEGYDDEDPHIFTNLGYRDLNNEVLPHLFF